MKNTESSRSSLFVGRWQPFHSGHKKLIETVLKTGKSVVIAIRDTEVSKNNPFSASERWSMIQKALHTYGHLVKIIVIPDIDEICYGRDVGYQIRRINLDADTERISATALRGALSVHPIYWITGQSGSGKTTLANALARAIGGVVLDGDEMRASISLHAGFGREDRHEHNIRVARLAGVLANRTPVIVSVIAPFQKTREEIARLISPVWIYVKRRLPNDKKKPYEVPAHPDIIVDTDNEVTQDQVKKILEWANKKI